ncbi:trypsin-like serine protease [Streptomyces sp. NPDC001296]
MEHLMPPRGLRCGRGSLEVDPDRLALVRTGDPGGCGSGYLVGPQLVLTALHVVRPERRWAGRVEARVGHPRYGAGPVDRRAQVCWPDPHRDVPPADALDVALLWLEEPVDTGEAPVRWGRPGGVVPVPFEGAGFPAFAADAGSPAHFEYLRGELPGVSTSSLGWVLDCPVWPASGRGKERPWDGASGSAIFCHGRLVGVVAEDNQSMGYRRLHAVPVHEALSLPGFADLVTKRGHPGTTTTLEEVTADGVGSRARLSPHIRTHADELARLRGKGAYLTQVPFVSPRDDSDPKRLFRRLARLTVSASEQESKRGVLLIGPAGAGKTRTCFEIAKEALKQRTPWQVLHVARSPEVSTDDVMAVIREQAGRQRVLLIFDYLDSYDALNLEAFGEALRTDDPEGRVACVASVRPGMLGKLRENGVALLLNEVPLRSDRAHTAEVISQIFTKVAPGMLETKGWGAKRLSEVCGQRPIIALLIARELESRLEARVSELDLVPPRPEDLLFWLQRRTKEDFGEPARETLLLASAVAAASCEQDQDAVETAVEQFLATWSDLTFRDGPEGVVGRLLHLGWLVESGQGIDVIHDVVTDEFLRMAVIPDGNMVRSDVLKTLLSAFLAGGRTFSVASRHLRRWTADLGDTHRRAVERACANWLVGSTDQLAALVAGEPQAGRSIMLTMLSGPPWRKGVDDSWDRLVRPWLEETEQRDPGKAATVLASAVRNSVGGVSEHLADACLAWVNRQWTTRDVSQLLRVLLEADGVSARDCDRAAEHALRSLEQQRTMTKTGARLVASLLRRNDLGADRAVAVVDFSLAWMRRSKRNPDAGLVLRPLLLRKDLDETRQTDAVGRALAWLGAQAQPSATALVLDAALRSENLQADKADRVTRRALAWLERYWDHIDASFVLEPLLARCRRETTDARVVLDHAFGWLGLHVSARRATYVLAEVLLREDLGARRAASAIDAAQAWLTEHGLTGDAKFLLSSLLVRSDIDREAVQKLGEGAVNWLTRHGLDNGGAYVMAALLRPDAAGGHVDKAARTALTLLDDTYNPTLVRSTLGHVLRCHGVGPDSLRDAVGRALDWLEETGPEFEATYVLEPLLERRRFLDGQTSRAVDLALDWLGRHGTRPEASFVLNPLLGLTDLTDEEAEAIERVAQEWLADHLPSENARFVLPQLLQQRQHARDWPEPVETLAFTWLRLHGDHPQASYVIAPLLQRWDAGRPTDAVDRALSWLQKNPTAEGAFRVVSALTEGPGIDLDQYARCIDRLLALLDAGPGPAAALLKGVRFWRDLDPGRAARLAEYALGVLEDEEIPPDRGLLIGLLRLALGPEHQCRAVRLAFRWLESPAAQTTKVGVLEVLLKRDDLRVDQLAGALEALEVAAHWINKTNSSNLGRLLGSVLGNPRVDASYQAGATRRALEWLGSYGTHPDASNVLDVLLDRLDLAPEDGETVAAHAEAWLAAVDSESWGRLAVEEALCRYRERKAAPAPPLS